MSSANTSGVPPGCVSIPVEIISTSNSNSSRNHSPYRRTYYDNSYNEFSNSPPWKRPTVNSYSRSRFQPRQTLSTAYDRLINNSPLNQSYNDRFFNQSNYEPQYHHFKPRTYEPVSLHISRSSEDLLSSTNDSIRSNNQSQNTSINSTEYNNNNNNNKFRSDLDFMEPTKHTTSLRRSYDALNDFSDKNKTSSLNQQRTSEQQSSYRPIYVNRTFINPNMTYSTDYRRPTNYYQSSTTEKMNESAHDRSHSPASQRSDSPTRPSPSSSQQAQESDFRTAKDATSQMSGYTTTSSSTTSNDQQVPSADIPVSANTPSALLRDPNTLALEKLEQIKQNLAGLNQQVDAFSGSTRDDRIYKELDEQALKMMMRCDELVDVSLDIKEKRKEMILNVQTVLAKLESKIPINPFLEFNSNNQMETAVVVTDSSANNNEEQKSSDPVNEEILTESSK